MAENSKNFLVVEIEKPYVLPELDQGSAAAVATLGSHPGFQYLVAKLKNQSALLKSTLAKKRQDSIRDVEFLQSGIVWCDWLEDQVHAATTMLNAKRPEPRDPRPAERETFERLLSQIDVIGASEAADNSR